MNYDLLKLGAASLATVGLYTVLYKENKFYRFWEHIFVGLVAGYSLVALWTEILKANWWDRMVGVTNDAGTAVESNGYWLYALLLPVGLMGYTIFTRKHNWISRIPIGVILGLYSGQQFQAWQNRYLPQVADSARSIYPNAGFFKPDTTGMSDSAKAAIDAQLYGSQALSNLIFVITLLSVVSYFLFSFDVKNKVLARVSNLGRWLLMIGFGAIFGTTVMMRFSLLIDRMYYVWIEFVQQGLLHR